VSHVTVELVRLPVRVRERSGRTLDQRLALRFPAIGRASARLIGKLPPSSRLRRAFLARAVRLASEAYNRRDLDAVTIGWHPECEYIPGREWIDSGLVEPRYLGRDGYRRYVTDHSAVWGDENYLIPREVIDLGDRFVILGTVPMRAQASGVSLTEAFAYVATLKGGRPIRFQEYFEPDEALKAVGLKE